MRLQGLWHNAKLYVWADGMTLQPSGDASAPTVPAWAAGVDVPPDAVLHAGAASFDQLAGWVADSSERELLTLWLPCDERGPVSEENAGGGPTSTESVHQGNGASNGVASAAVITHLAPVMVPSIVLTPEEGLLFLLGQIPAEEGSSLVYFKRLLRYVLNKAAARHFYGDIGQIRPGVYAAHWHLLPPEAVESAALSTIAAEMPASARCQVSTSILEPGRLVDSFVQTMSDGFIRLALSQDDWFARVHGLSRQMQAPLDVRWLSALVGTDPEVQGHPEIVSILSEIVRGWVGRLDAGRLGAPWRPFFVLREPELPEEFDEDGDATDGSELLWSLHVQLQSPGEDGQLVDAAQLWDEVNDPAVIFGRSVADRRGQLITDLHRASGACPPLARFAGDPAPTQLSISTPEAHLFIRQWGPALEAAGFGINVPDWAAGRDKGVGLMLALRPMAGPPDEDLLEIGQGGAGGGATPWGEVGAGQFGLESLLDFDWQIAVGDLRLTPAEFRQLAGQGSPLVRYRGQWVQIDPDAGKKAVAFLEKESSGKITLAEAFKTAYGIRQLDTGLQVLGLTGSDWLDTLLGKAPDARTGTVQQPTGFGGMLRPYQLRGLDWLAFLDRLGLGGCLADDMGLGKTIQFIALLLHERERAEGKSPGPTLLFAPTSVVGNWVKELERFAPQLRVLLHHGPQRLVGNELREAVGNSDVVLTSYALAHRDAEDLKTCGWHRIAVDEAQKIKNPLAAASVAIRAIPSRKKVALTGTPVENHLSELWSIMELLNPGLLGTATEFRERFSIPIEKQQDRERLMRLRRMIQPFVLRRNKNDPEVAGDLPEKMEMKVFCNLTAEQASVYERITGEMLGQIDAATGIRRRGLILAALTRLKQVCDHPILLDKENIEGANLDRRSGKCERLLEMLEEVNAAGDAALIFTQYREMGHLLERLIHSRLKAKTLFLHGGTPARQRQVMIERFQAPGSEERLFILSLRAGGLGLNLTAANHVFHFDRWWNPAVEQQATDRAHRIGQTRKVQVHQFICVGTLEERIDKLLTDKLALADQVVGAGDDWLTNLSTDQLRQYLSLSHDAVGVF